MKLVFDTSILIELERKDEDIIRKISQLREQYPDAPAITAPTFAEFYYGFLKKFPHKAREALKELEKYVFLSETRESAQALAELRLLTEKEGKTMGLYDLFIAAIVRSYGGVLVTRDKQFKHIPQLSVIIM